MGRPKGSKNKKKSEIIEEIVKKAKRVDISGMSMTDIIGLFKNGKVDLKVDGRPVRDISIVDGRFGDAVHVDFFTNSNGMTVCPVGYLRDVSYVDAFEPTKQSEGEGECQVKS